MRLSRDAIAVLIFTVITLLLTAELAHVISDNGHGGSQHYSALFTDVVGVEAGDDVRLAGVQVGEVSGIHLVDRSIARVDFTVEAGVPVYADAHAQIRYLNLIGQRYLSLIEAPGPRVRLPSNGVIPLGATTSALNLTTLFDGFKPLFEALQPSQVNELSSEIVAALNGEGGTVQQLLATTASLTTTLANRDAVIGRVITNLNTVLATVDSRDSALNSLIDSFQTLLKGLATDSGVVGNALPQIASLMTATNGLLTDVRPNLASDVANLQTLAGQLAATKGDLDAVIKALPQKLNVLTRAGTYGSWFNFYVCGLNVNLTLLGKQIQLSTPVGVEDGDKGTVCEAAH